MARLLQLFGLLCILLAPTASDAGDLSLEWRTLETRHFQLHFPANLGALARRAARICEEAWQVLTPIWEHEPDRRIQVLLTDFGDGSNGSATALPFPRITLLAAPPSLAGNLGNYNDWLRLLIFHELTHILQLDVVNGWPWLLNRVLGRTTAPNQNMPSFQLEGGAVWAESFVSGRGRIHSSSFRGVLRAQALADSLYGIDVVTHAPFEYPGPNVWYLYGGHFFDWIARTRGPDRLPAAHRATSDEIVPFGVNRSAIESMGQPFTELFIAWQAELKGQARSTRARLERAGLTPLEKVTNTGRRHSAPRILRDGTLLFSEGAGNRRPGIYARDLRQGPGSGQLIFERSPGQFDPCVGTRRLLYSATERYRGAYTFADLFTFDAETGAHRRITWGGRLREPACAPDGRWAVAAQLIEGRTRLVRVDLSDGQRTVLFDSGGIDQVGYPTITPDGSGVVFSSVRGGVGWHLLHLDLATGAVRTLDDDAALDLYPRFSPDGRWLVFSSDRSGIFDIYAKRWPDGPIQRVTRVLTGASQPVVTQDGKSVVFTLITAKGTDLASAPFDSAQFLPLDPSVIPDAIPQLAASDAPLPEHPYRALDTLWPTRWQPAFSFSNASDAASQLGLEADVTDAASQHLLSIALSAEPDEGALNIALNHVWMRPAASLVSSFSRVTRTNQRGAFFGAQRQPWRQSVTSGSTGLSIPLTRGGGSTTASFRYGLTAFDRAQNDDPRYDPLDPAPRFPQNTRTANVSMGLRYSSAVGYAEAISVADGRSLGASLRLRHPRLGGTLETAELFVDYTEYFPLWGRHTLGTRLSTAFGRGDSGRRVFYALGTPPERNLLLDAFDEVYFGSTYLRGYPSSTVAGDRYALFTAEYRLPLLDVFGGPATAPVFLRRFKLALFTDWGQAGNSPLEASPSAFKRSVGAEVVAQTTIAWRLLVSARMGWARGLDADGEDQIYFFLGRWF